MSEHSDISSLIPASYRGFFAESDVTDAQLADYLARDAGFLHIIDEYANTIGLGFTADDMLLMQKVGFSLSDYRKQIRDGGGGNGHHELWLWIESQYRQLRADKAGISVSEFVTFWRNLPDELLKYERTPFLKDYIYARQYTDIPARTLHRLPQKLVDMSRGHERHTIRGSYVPLARLCWSHEQIMDVLEMVEYTSDVKYVREVARKGLWYEEIYTWLNEGLGIENLALKLRIPSLQSNEAKELVAFLMRYIQENVVDLSIGRTLGEIHQYLHEALLAYHDDRTLENLSHEEAMSKAVDTFYPIP